MNTKFFKNLSRIRIRKEAEVNGWWEIEYNFYFGNGILRFQTRASRRSGNRGAISNKMSIDGTVLASNSAKIWRGICPPFLLVPPALQTNTAYLVLLMLGCCCCKKTKLSRCMQTFHKASWLPHINITTDKTSRSLILGQFKYESLLMTQWMSRLFDHDKYTVYIWLFFCTIMLLWPLPMYVLEENCYSVKHRCPLSKSNFLLLLGNLGN